MNQPSTSLPATARGLRTRRKLVEAAEVVFGEKGFEAASISDITRQAGVALGTFYVYFADKRALFVEVVDGLGARLREALAEGIAAAGTGDRLAVERAGFDAFFRFVSRHRLLYRVVRQAEFIDQECFRRYYRSFAEPYARALERAQAAGELRRLDPEALAYALMGMADFLGMRYVLWGRGRQAEAALEAAVDFIRGGMAAVPPAPAARARRSRSGRAGRKA
ncbi:TetR/AcrR family transcriptional regulator [Anaeromyxobacter sp. Red801]|uniref:TetR/AcrR family transcriptional regulator n=1 Tax=Anaeromyxobacter sp. Red801 TaxID=3411632 RepID=UPI003BA2F077